MKCASPNKAKHGDIFYVEASPPLQSSACWQRYKPRSGSVAKLSHRCTYFSAEATVANAFWLDVVTSSDRLFSPDTKASAYSTNVLSPAGSSSKISAISGTESPLASISLMRE